MGIGPPILGPMPGGGQGLNPPGGGGPMPPMGRPKPGGGGIPPIGPMPMGLIPGGGGGGIPMPIGGRAAAPYSASLSSLPLSLPSSPSSTRAPRALPPH